MLALHEPWLCASPSSLPPPGIAESLHLSKGANHTKSVEKDPILVQLDPKWCANLIIPLTTERLTCDKSRCCPQGVLQTDDSRTDFFTIYRKEAAEYDRDYSRSMTRISIRP